MQFIGTLSFLMNLEYESYKNVSGPHFPSDVAFHHFPLRFVCNMNICWIRNYKL